MKDYDSARFNLEKAFNSAVRREKREYLDYKKSGDNNKFKLAKFFWVKDIVEEWGKIK